MNFLIKLSVLLPLLFLLEGTTQQPLPSEAPDTVLAMAWAFVFAESVVIAVLWRQLNFERNRINDLVEIVRKSSEDTRELLRQDVQKTKEISDALKSLDSRLDVRDDVKALLERSE